MPGTAQGIAGFHRLGQFDLDHIGAPVGELAHACRPRPHPGQIKHGKAFQRIGSRGRAHFGILFDQ